MNKPIAIILIMLLLLFTGCAGQGGVSESPKPEPTAEATAGPTAEPTAVPTAEPTDEPTPYPTDPVGIAKLHGLGADDLRGEYELFMRFSETVEANPGLGEYRELVYRIFPVIADHTEYLETEYFFEKLAALEFIEEELDPGTVGQYRSEPNTIVISPDRGLRDDPDFPSIVFHELIHFLDYAMTDGPRDLYLLDGEFITSEELLALPMSDMIRAVVPYTADLITEGCAELYTAKYFAGSVRWYFRSCSILTGLEYIYGTQKLDELFFSSRSDVMFCKLFLDAGYSEDEYHDACGMLNWITYPIYTPKPSREVCAEDILIRLYEAELGSGWQTDEYFLYILKSINGVAWSGYEGSEHEGFLSTIEFETREQYDDFLAKLYAGLPAVPELSEDPPIPVIIGGRPMLTAYAAWTDLGTGTTVRGTVAAEYDFEADTPLGYELTDLGALLQRYFG